jgi:hypothetical protein
MRESLKAALFSAFLFPGSGYFLLKRQIRGVLAVGFCVFCLVVLVSFAMEKAQAISLKIQTGEIPLDITRITEEVSILVSSGDTLLANFASYGLLVCWLVSIFDGYRIGRLVERAESARDSKPGAKSGQT